jgi:CRP-like cAMP-binding protein
MPGIKKSSFKIQNNVLLSLPKTALDKLLPELESISLPLGHVVFKAGDRIDSALFLNSGMVSLVAASSTGNSIEVGAVGKEGMVPVEVLSDLQHVAHRAVVQVPGEALKISIARLEHHLPNEVSLLKRYLNFMQVLHSQSTQLVLCNRFHTVQQRLCRWLLMTSDWAESDHFPITHEFLSLMLGMNRSTVTLELGALKSKGIISYRQRLLEVKDRRQIASMSCECYWTHKRDMDSYTKALQVSGTAGPSSTRLSSSRSTGARGQAHITAFE